MIDALEVAGWPRRPMVMTTGRRAGRFQVVFTQSAMDVVHLHGQSKPDVEVCGVLVGNGYVDDHGPYLRVEAAIQGTAAGSRSTNVTFTAETWQQIQQAMDRDHASQKMIGWYHTHPGFGIFLSDMDLFICDNFFNLPWQVAFVYDPVSGEEGNFAWVDGKPKREDVLIEDDVTPIAAKVPLIDKMDAITGGARVDKSTMFDRSVVVDESATAADHRVRELLVRVKRLEQRQRMMMIAMLFMAAFIVMGVFELSKLAGYDRAVTQSTTRR